MKKHLSLLVFFILFLCACGPRNSNNNRLPEQSDQTIDWKNRGFAVSGKANETTGLWVDHYEAWNLDARGVDGEKEQALPLSRGVFGSKTYRLYTVIQPPVYKGLRWILEIYDADSGNYEVREISRKQLGLDPDDPGYLLDMDIADEENYVFQWITLAEDGNKFHQTSDKRIYSNLEGDVHVVDLWDAYLERGIAEDLRSDVLLIPEGSCICDGFGNTYIVKEEKSKETLYAFDRDGEEILQYEIPSGWTEEGHFRAEGGEMIYSFYDGNGKSHHLVWADIGSTGVRELAEIPDSQKFTKIYGMWGNEVYFETYNGAYRWNVADGKRSVLLSFREHEIPTRYDKLLVIKEDGVPLFRFTYDRESEDWLVSLSDKEPSADRAVRIADFVWGGVGSTQIKEGISQAMKKDPNCSYVYEAVNTKEKKDRLWSELMAGDGPDLLYVSRQDFATLVEKGALLDLSDLMPSGYWENVLPGALELGTVDGKLFGIAPSIWAEGLLVSEKTWKEETWNIDEFLGLMQDHKLDGSFYYYEPYAAVIWVVEMSLHDSWLIDWEAGKSHFNGERFIKLLDLMRRESTSEEGETWLGEGNRVAYRTFYSPDFIYDFGIREEQENGHYVGFPTDGEAGNYIDTQGLLVVNVESQKKAAVQEFISRVLSEDVLAVANQGLTNSLSVFKPLPKEIVQDEDGKLWADGRELSVFEDNTTTIDRAIDFLESCVAAPLHEMEIENIVREELETYFAGDRSAKEAAEIIHNRVQLYLDENL